jgi:hypothetical protein
MATQNDPCRFAFENFHGSKILKHRESYSGTP